MAALFVGMRMIRGDNQFSFRSVETLLQDWMEAIKKVELKAVGIIDPVSLEFSPNDDLFVAGSGG